jgi:16S rRNA processing protein RimM
VSEDGRILVGVVGAPHGVKGELRLKSYTDEPMTLATFGTLWAGNGRRLSIASARPLRDDMLVVRLDGIGDRDAAAALTNLPLYVARCDLPTPEEEEYYHADLIGLAAETTGGEPCGQVIALQNFGAGDLLEIAPAVGDTFLVPFTKAFVPVVDVPGRRLVVTPEAIPDDARAAEPGEPA